jgi:hypothetical protein
MRLSGDTAVKTGSIACVDDHVKKLIFSSKEKKILIFLPNKLHEHQAPLSSVGAGADRSRQTIHFAFSFATS